MGDHTFSSSTRPAPHTTSSEVERRFGPLMAGGEDLAVSQVLQDSQGTQHVSRGFGLVSRDERTGSAAISMGMRWWGNHRTRGDVCVCLFGGGGVSGWLWVVACLVSHGISLKSCGEDNPKLLAMPEAILCEDGGHCRHACRGEQSFALIQSCCCV